MIGKDEVERRGTEGHSVLCQCAGCADYWRRVERAEEARREREREDRRWDITPGFPFY